MRAAGIPWEEPEAPVFEEGWLEPTELGYSMRSIARVWVVAVQLPEDPEHGGGFSRYYLSASGYPSDSLEAALPHATVASQNFRELSGFLERHRWWLDGRMAEGTRHHAVTLADLWRPSENKEPVTAAGRRAHDEWARQREEAAR